VKVLGIETATDVCGAAVVVDGKVVHDAYLKERYVHAERLMGLIDASLKVAGMEASDIDGCAVSSGPGSFTGLRIGISVAKGLAYSMNRPLVAVPTLRALATGTFNSLQKGNTQSVLAVLDARRDEVYCQLFRASDGVLEPVWDEKDMTLADLIDRLGDRAVTVTGDGRTKLRAYVRANTSAKAGMFKHVPDEIAECTAGSIAILGEKLLQEGKVIDAAELQPLYIKEFYSPVRTA